MRIRVKSVFALMLAAAFLVSTPGVCKTDPKAKGKPQKGASAKGDTSKAAGARNAAAAQALAKLDPDLANEIFAVLERATRSADMQTRAVAVENIARVRPEVAKDYVVDALKDPQWVVRRAAISALISMGSDAYRTVLAQAIVNPTLYEKRELSPLGLVLSLPTQEAIELLKETLEKADQVRDIVLKEIFKKDSPLARDFYQGLNSVPAVKGWVLQHMEMFQDKDMYPLLVKTIPGMGKQELLTTFTFLENLDPSYDVSFLQNHMKSDDEEIAEAAAYNLALRGNASAADRILGMCDENDVKRQIRCLNGVKGVPDNIDVKERAKLFLYGDPDPDVLYAVYDLFTRANDDSIYDRVVQRLQSTNLGHRAASVYFLGKLRGTRALPELHQLLRDGSSLIRIRAAKAIGELRQAESVPSLADALRNDADTEVRKVLVNSLGQIADRSVIDVVSFLIFDPQVKDEAIDALCAIRHKDAINTLRNVLQTQFTKEQRSKALKAIIRISPEAGLPIFKTAMGWLPPGFLEELAAELKGQFLDYLTAAMGSTNEEIRIEAVGAFRHLGKEVESQFIEREVFNVRESALRILMLERLAEVGSPNANKMIEAFLKDESAEVRLAAIRMVSKYASKEQNLLDELKKMLMDPDESDRVASAAALLNIHLLVK